MSMLWVGLGAAVVGGAASVVGSSKQASAAKNAAKINQNQYANTVALENPYNQSGYGALGKLNTLLGIGGAPSGGAAPTAPAASQAPNPMPTPVMQPTGQTAPAAPQQWWGGNPQSVQPSSTNRATNPQLRQLLAVRAQNGDAQANQLLKAMQ